MSFRQKTKKNEPLPAAVGVEDVTTRHVIEDINKVLVKSIRNTHDDISNAFNNPFFSVHKNGTNQTAVVTATATKVTFSTEEADSHSYFASDKFTPLVVGYYLLIGAVEFTVGAAAAEFTLHIYKNGSEYKRVTTVMGGTGNEGFSIQAIVDADGVDDYFELYVTQSTGSDKIIDGTATKTWFQGHKLPIKGK